MRKALAPIAVICMIMLVVGCGQKPDRPSSGRMENSGDLTAPSLSRDAVRSQRSVVAETLAYAEIDERIAKGHFAFPEDMIESYPAIILIHDWWGLNDNFRKVADRMAAEGFVVLAVDLFDGQTATTSPDARQLMLNVVEHPEFAAKNIQQANEWLRSTAGAEQVVVVGYGLGGGWSLNAAIALPDQLNAAVILYGQVSANEETLTPVKAPILGFFGSDDNVIPMKSVTGFETAMQTLRKDCIVEIYPGVKGGFAIRGERNFDSDLESKTWETMLKFLRQHTSDAETKVT